MLIAPVKNEEGIAVMYIVNHEDVTWSPDRDDVALQGMTTFVLFNDIALIPGLVI